MNPLEQTQHIIDLTVQLRDQISHVATWLEHERLVVASDELAAALDHLVNARRQLTKLAGNE